MMSLSQIRIANVRNIKEAVVYPGPNLNIILGDNGSGKSSFLESIYLLGRAGSFRTRFNSEMINTEAKQLSVSGTLKRSANLESRIGVSIESKKKR